MTVSMILFWLPLFVTLFVWFLVCYDVSVFIRNVNMESDYSCCLKILIQMNSASAIMLLNSSGGNQAPRPTQPEPALCGNSGMSTWQKLGSKQAHRVIQ